MKFLAGWRRMAHAGTDASRVLEALRRVHEPELLKDIVTLNMVKDVEVKGSTVSLTFVLTTPACPYKGEIENSIREELLKLEGIQNIQIRMEAVVPKSRDMQGLASIPG